MHKRTTLFLSLLMATVTPSSFGQSSPSAEHRHDHPTNKSPQAAKPELVHFPKQLRDHTLANMRDHLSVIAEIQGYLAAHRFDDAAEIAEQRLGMSSLKLHGAHEVAKYMPKGMQDAGSAMHRSASRFALVAQESAVNKDMEKPLAALATLTQACVACHAGYRLR
jgi:hypothetical protein